MRADDLLVLLEVARAGTLTTAAASLGLNHATISRRLDAMERMCGGPLVTRTSRGCHITELGRGLLESGEAVERALASANAIVSGTEDSATALTGLVRISAPEAFSARFAAPALTRLQRKHPRVSVELTTATRPIVTGSGMDVEIGVGDPLSPRVRALDLGQYDLGLYAAPPYLAERGTPRSPSDLRHHVLVYYVDRLLRVTDLHMINQLFGGRSVDFGSTSVFSQYEAARSGVGIALLPKFLVRTTDGLVPVLAAEASVRLKFVAVLAQTQLRRAPAVAALKAIREEVVRRHTELVPPSP